MLGCGGVVAFDVSYSERRWKGACNCLVLVLEKAVVQRTVVAIAGPEGKIDFILE